VKSQYLAVVTLVSAGALPDKQRARTHCAPEVDALDALRPAKLGAQAVEAHQRLGAALAAPLKPDGIKFGGVDRPDADRRDLVDLDRPRRAARLLREPRPPVLRLLQQLLLVVEAHADSRVDRRVLLLRVH